MKKIITLFIFTIILTSISKAQDDYKYHRSSLYSVLLKHNERPFASEIIDAFYSIPIPEKFDNHNLSKRVFKAAILEKNDTTELNDQKAHIDELLSKNAIGRRLVAKWFNHSKDGTFNIELLAQRGFYDASAFDIDLSDKTVVGKDLFIRDAGNELISNTYVLVNDIVFYDRRETGKTLSSVASGIGLAASFIPGVGLFAPAATIAATSFTDIVAGFSVKVTSYLYKLDWTENIEGTFYYNYWTSIPNEEKAKAFSLDKKTFTLQYVGQQTVKSGITTMKGVNKKEEFFVKVCTRALDKSIAQLQKEHQEFRVKTPLLSTEPLTAQIGIKEDVTEESRYEVLEVSIENGLTKYKRVGVIKPIKNKIWDNRYLAEFEEENQNIDLTATEFEKISGGDFYQGMLIREIND